MAPSGKERFKRLQRLRKYFEALAKREAQKTTCSGTNRIGPWERLKKGAAVPAIRMRLLRDVAVSGPKTCEDSGAMTGLARTEAPLGTRHNALTFGGALAAEGGP